MDELAHSGSNIVVLCETNKGIGVYDKETESGVNKFSIKLKRILTIKVTNGQLKQIELGNKSLIMQLLGEKPIYNSEL